MWISNAGLALSGPWVVFFFSGRGWQVLLVGPFYQRMIRPHCLYHLCPRGRVLQCWSTQYRSVQTLSKHSPVFALYGWRWVLHKHALRLLNNPTQSLLSPSANTVFIMGLPWVDIVTLAMHVFQPAALNCCASQASCGGSSWGSQQLTYKTSGRSRYIHHSVWRCHHCLSSPPDIYRMVHPSDQVCYCRFPFPREHRIHT